MIKTAQLCLVKPAANIMCCCQVIDDLLITHYRKVGNRFATLLAVPALLNRCHLLP